jgi:cytochrome c-type biogenesis protein CcmE
VRAPSRPSFRALDSTPMERRRSPVRLIIALSIAAALTIFLLYTSFAGGATPALKPSQLKGHRGKLAVSGYVLGPVKGDAHSAAGMRFRLRDIDGTHKSAEVPVVFHGSKPDLFRAGRHVYVTGTFDGRRVLATEITTKCPSKYSPAKSS